MSCWHADTLAVFGGSRPARALERLRLDAPPFSLPFSSRFRRTLLEGMSQGYMEAFDPRKSGRVSLQSFQPQFHRCSLPPRPGLSRSLYSLIFRFSSSSASSSLPADLLLSLALSKSLLALSLYIARDWLLAQGFSAWALNAVVLAAGAAGLAVWERIWETPRGFSKRKEVSYSAPKLDQRERDAREASEPVKGGLRLLEDQEDYRYVLSNHRPLLITGIRRGLCHDQDVRRLTTS